VPRSRRGLPAKALTIIATALIDSGSRMDEAYLGCVRDQPGPGHAFCRELATSSAVAGLGAERRSPIAGERRRQAPL
jgi:hypothetical protein